MRLVILQREGADVCARALDRSSLVSHKVNNTRRVKFTFSDAGREWSNALTQTTAVAFIMHLEISMQQKYIKDIYLSINAVKPHCKAIARLPGRRHCEITQSIVSVLWRHTCDLTPSTTHLHHCDVTPARSKISYRTPLKSMDCMGDAWMIMHWSGDQWLKKHRTVHYLSSDNFIWPTIIFIFPVVFWTDRTLYIINPSQMHSAMSIKKTTHFYLVHHLLFNSHQLTDYTAAMIYSYPLFRQQCPIWGYTCAVILKYWNQQCNIFNS